MNKQLKVLMITGSYPPDICGVGDYVHKLSSVIRDHGGIDLHIYHERNWSYRNTLKIIRSIKAYDADVIHLQYPTEGYKYSLVPQLISLFFSGDIVVTLHELSKRNLLGKLATIFFLFFAGRIIFTTETERNYARKICPWINRKSTIINIGSNIPFKQVNSDDDKSSYDIAYFGHIRPLKGLEEVLSLAKEAKESGKQWNFIVIGQTLDRFTAYFSELQEMAAGLNIKWALNVTEETVAELLRESRITYLPYPDGVSLRRGTFIAAMLNSNFIITTRGDDTPDDFKDLCHLINKPNEAWEIANYFLNGDSKMIMHADRLKANSGIYAKRFFWTNIAHDHLSFYKEFKP